jgi:hypothetical protein
MESILRDIPNIVVYIDDILITGTSEEEHLETIHRVLNRLETAGLRAKKQKCMYMVPSVEYYVSYKIDAKGLHPLPEKVRAGTSSERLLAPEVHAGIESLFGVTYVLVISC